MCVYTEEVGTDVLVCRLPFMELSRVAAVFPYPQEMTRRIWDDKSVLQEQQSMASPPHIPGTIYSSSIPSGTNGIIITGRNMIFKCLNPIILLF